MKRLTKEQAAIIGAFTGFTAGPSSDIQEYAEKKLGRPIFTHEFADSGVAQELRDASREDFLAICYEEGHNNESELSAGLIDDSQTSKGEVTYGN